MINWFVERKNEHQISIGKEYEAKITLPIGKYSIQTNLKPVYVFMDFFIDGQKSSFCPDQPEAEGKLLTIIMINKLTQ